MGDDREAMRHCDRAHPPIHSLIHPCEVFSLKVNNYILLSLFQRANKRKMII